MSVDPRTGRRKRRPDRLPVPVTRVASEGQSTVETVAMLPLLCTIALAVGHVLAAGLTHEMAGHAAHAAAIAVIRGGDPEAAVHASLPEWSRDRVDVRVSGRKVRVRLRPPSVIPGAADLLASTAAADAGPTRMPALAGPPGPPAGR